MKERVRGKKVSVGVSGGVDSSVSLALLQAMGAQVTGVFMKGWYPSFIECTWKQDKEFAMRTCAHLKVPFKTVDLSKEYEADVVQYLINEYKQGRTPNPDIMCNKHIKFGAFADSVHGLQSSDYIATGHYARSAFAKEENFSPVLKAFDEQKDQTYFLWASDREVLSKTLFPLGSIKKDQVRDIANMLDLPSAQKSDSQGVCFMGEIDVADFLSHYIESVPGNVLNDDGDIIGKHEGSLFLTLGQRHGFTITKKTPNDERMVIISKDSVANTITVSPHSKAKEHYTTHFTVDNINLLDASLKENEPISLRVRHRGDLVSATLLRIDKESGRATIECEKSPGLIASGQSLVWYHDSYLSGGGILS